MSRSIAVDDFARIVLASDPRFSPDGTKVTFVRTHADTRKNVYRSAIWVANADGSGARRFTGGDWSDSSPRWSPDGKRIAFASTRSKPKGQVFVIASDGGEAEPLTRLEMEGSVSAIRWSPDGKRIAFLHRATPEYLTRDAKKAREEDELPPPPRFHDRLCYRLDGSGYYDGSYPQVWCADAATGEAKQLTSGAFPCGEPVWSPDSQSIAFLSDRRPEFYIAPWQEDIWIVPAAGGELKLVPTQPLARYALSWSPDGKWFAWAGQPKAEDVWGDGNNRVFIAPVTGGDARDLTGDSDLEVGYATLSDSHEVGAGDGLRWTDSSEAIFFPVSVNGDTRLAFVTLAGGSPQFVSPEGYELGGFDITPDGRAAVTMASGAAPQSLQLLTHVPGQGVTMRPLAQPNAEWLAEVSVTAPKPVEIPSTDGVTVHGWYLEPSGVKAGAKAPGVLYVHGGPHLQYGNSFFHELQWLAAEGFAVLYVNPRGSKGYGEAHTKAIHGDWGSKDYVDIMAAADYLAARPEVDASRTAIMGGSYGGYMTAWAVGHTKRFRCAIADRLVANLHSMAGTSDFPFQHGRYWQGNAWSEPEDLYRCSPLKFAGDIETPLLLIHSDGDLRCDVGQAEELFAALKMQRKTAEFVRYPAETSHGLSRNGPPNLRLDRLQRNVEWLKRWLCA